MNSRGKSCLSTGLKIRWWQPTVRVQVPPPGLDVRPLPAVFRRPTAGLGRCHLVRTGASGGRPRSPGIHAGVAPGSGHVWRSAASTPGANAGPSMSGDRCIRLRSVPRRPANRDDRLPRGGDGFVRPPGRSGGVAEIAVRLGVVGPGGDRPPQHIGRRGMPPGLPGEQSRVVQALRVVRPGGQNPPVRALCQPSAVRKEMESQMDTDEHRSERNGPFGLCSSVSICGSTRFVRALRQQ